MPESFSVTLSVTPEPLRAPVRWAESKAELLPFDPGRAWDITNLWPLVDNETLGKLVGDYWIAYNKGGHEAALKAIENHPGQGSLPAPPDIWKFPRLTITAVPVGVSPPYVTWEGLPPPVGPLWGFYSLWRALQKDMKSRAKGLRRFRAKVLEVVPRIGLLRSPEKFERQILQQGGLRVMSIPFQDTLYDWLEATVWVRFWSEVLTYGVGLPVWDFLEGLRSWYPDEKRWLSLLKKLRTPTDPQNVLTMVESIWPVGAAIELLHLHLDKPVISERAVREYLQNQGIRGLLIPGPLLLTRGEEGRPYSLSGYIGAYHHALLELSRYRGHRATCAHCGKAFIRERKTGRYCSGACRMAASRERQRGSG